MGNLLREGVAALLSLVLLAVAIYFLLDTYWGSKADLDASHIAAFGRQKDIAQTAITLLSAVMGYYFGRVPAEKRADRAEEQSAIQTQKSLELKSEVHSRLLEVKKLITSPSSAEAGTNVGMAIDRLLHDLEKADSPTALRP